MPSTQASRKALNLSEINVIWCACRSTRDLIGLVNVGTSDLAPGGLLEAKFHATGLMETLSHLIEHDDRLLALMPNYVLREAPPRGRIAQERQKAR